LAIINTGDEKMRYLTVSEVARLVGSRPRAISDLFYKRELSDDACPIVGNRRLIPPDYVPVIVHVLQIHKRIKWPDAQAAKEEPAE